MAKNTIKGITVEIGGDTTKLGKALENVNKKSSDLSSELGNINRLLKMDPGNAELLAQKQKVLASAVENTSDKLRTLKEAEQQVQQQFERGEVSEAQVRELQREIVATEQKLKSYKRAIQETAQATQELGDESKDTSDVMANAFSNGLKTVTGLAAAAVTGLTASAESSRDYRMEMGKLNTAFTDNGFSSDAATGAYKELVGVLGETDQAVETANHLAKLTENEQDLAKWTGDILPGVFATFGDSLPIEGLTEAANETAKVGQVTGPLADALNWAGVNEEAFNESLAKCTTEQERQALITETLSGLYGKASEAYKTTNADVIAANLANDNLAASNANLGATVEPLLTQVKDIGATLLTNIVPTVSWILNNLPTLGIILAGATAAMVAFKISAIAATAATKGMTLAQYAAAAAQRVLNAVMKANPVGLVIIAITALIAAFKLLWDNCEWFRNFWKGLWEGIKKVVAVVVDWIKQAWNKMLNFEPVANVIAKCKAFFSDFRANVSKIIDNVKSKFNGFVTTLKKLPANIWNAIVGAVKRVQTWGSNLASKAKSAASNFLNGVVNTVKNIPSRISSAINGALSRVTSWGKNMASRARSGMNNVVTTIKNAFKNLPSNMANIGRNLIEGLWNGIKNMGQWIKNKIKGFTDGVLSDIKNFFGIKSPSKETEWMGEMLDEGLAQGVTKHASAPVSAMRTLTDDMLAQDAAFNGLNLNRRLSQNFGAESPATAASSGLMTKLDKILAAIERGQILTIDGKSLVGSTINAYDSKLGQRRALAERGAL